MQPKIRRLLTIALAAPLALGACGPDADEGDYLEIDAPEAGAPEPTAPTGPITVVLGPVGTSGIQGEASAMHRGEDVELTLALNGLTADADYTATVEPGTCPMGDGTTPGTGEGGTEDDPMAGGDEMDEEIADIDLQVSANGATGSATVSAEDLEGGAHIAVHDESDTLVACGDIDVSGAMGGSSHGTPPAGEGGQGSGGD